jgi:DNA-binding transcriptional MocR family regulator
MAAGQHLSLKSRLNHISDLAQWLKWLMRLRLRLGIRQKYIGDNMYKVEDGIVKAEEPKGGYKISLKGFLRSPLYYHGQALSQWLGGAG